ncbi:TPR and ankyrin repeat-containing protein 1 [Pelobates fuscus]|uniref:TPR and ankyrin repeat-containing protein 1 n=1 Tax=Pelobates fuscus TaxID=191477 RepID=UPI002FE4BE83
MYQACLFLKSASSRLPRGINLNVSLKVIFERFFSVRQNSDMTAMAELVSWLITMNAKVETIGNYPLHAALKLCIHSDHNNLFKLILEKKPEFKDNINQKDENGHTLLHIVASSRVFLSYTLNRQAQDIKMLLDYGCDSRIANNEGKKVSAILKKNKNFKAEELIKKHLENQSLSRSLSAEQSEACKPHLIENDSADFASALEQFTDFCKNKTQSDRINKFFKHKKVKSFLDVLSKMKEIPSEFTCDIPASFVQRIIEHLVLEKKWQDLLLLMTRNVSGDTTIGNQGLFTRYPQLNIDIGTVLNNMEPTMTFRLPLVTLLLDQGVSSNGIKAACESPIHVCLKKNDYALAFLLLSKGGNPHSLSMEVGDTPLHVAVSIALKNKDDGVLMLAYLLDLYSSQPSKYMYLDPNKQDSNGDTLMHLLFRCNNQKQCRKVIDLLAKFDIKLTIPNKQGKDARYRIKNTDPRLTAWNEAKMIYKRKSSVSSKTLNSSNGVVAARPQTKSPGFIPLSFKTKHDKTSVKTDSCEQASGEPSSEIEHNILVKQPMTLREKIVQEVRDVIKSLMLSMVPTEPKSSSSEMIANKEKSGGLLVSYPNSVAVANNHSEDQNTVTDDAMCSGNGLPLLCNNNEEMELQEAEIDLTKIDFNNMTWEIECAPEALKKLGSKSVPQHMKNKIILSIQKLGNGEWTRSLHKQLKCSKSDIKLYEVKLDKGARMLWELAIDFSPRCSEEPENIMESVSSHFASEKTGRVYTEIIRIWDIVLDHCKLNHAIENICSAYNRGLMCILRKKLKRITKTRQCSNVENRIPKCFVEDIEDETNNDHLIPDYFPPASSAEMEFNIMKFHSFSTDMALNILNNLNTRVEYPFRVGELEFAVIDLNPKPMEAIILIGRSGTGKTTCCMYRLWKKFHSYWEKVELTGEPWFVKQTWQRRKYNENIKQDETDDEDTVETETSESTDEEQAPPEAEDLSEEVCSLDSGDGENESEHLEHYHPVFITKNHVLCQEVQRSFMELSNSTKATSHFKPVEPNVFKLQSLQDENFPLFLTSQQFLLLLDASMPDPFFPRNEDGSLKRSIIGWSTADELDIPDLLREDDEVDADLENDEDETPFEMKEKDPRVFVTFEVFTNDLWPKMVKGKFPFNAALVWKEIKSFLKGSFEALQCPQGRLTEEQYIKLGKKRAPNFQGDRKEIYRLFCLYEQIKSKRGCFDEEDVMYNLSCRVSNLEELPWSFHELYGDEIQDFTQAELFLLMRCINDPNSMFLTGDTAQSIMKGVSFRFSDLRSLFFYASKNCANRERNCIVRKPKRIYQLHQNYRSHSGILLLASGVVDLLQHYFPESFDRLPRDCGLFDGPKPTVLESCSVSDLAILLRGNQRKTQAIEFGAHQVILVKNELAKERIPEELSLALVLTIYEAKGLEFDDVLLYNFFTDSEAPKEWKIISSFKPALHEIEDKRTIIEVPLDTMAATTTRPLPMNPDLHKILNGELKQLYTAITRARVNLWIFDENQEKRAPAFGYFMEKKIVKVVKADENTDLDDKMFVRTSSKEEWISRGDYYAKHKFWKVAAKCFQKGGAKDKEKLAFTHDAVLNLQSKKPKDKMEYIRLAKTYLECGEYKLALKCLTWAKEYHLCADLCKKLGKNKEAGSFFKKIMDHEAAAQCFEQCGEFELALNLYLELKKYEEAAAVVERHKGLNPDGLLSHTTKQLYLEAAADHFNNNKLKKMNEVLSKLDIDDHLLFLKTRKCWSEAADLLKSNGQSEEAATLMRHHGKLSEAADLTTKREFRASCLLALARCMIEKKEDLGSVLLEAMQIFEKTENRLGIAEALLLQGIVESDFEMLCSSYNTFRSLSHYAGVVEALFYFVKCGNNDKKILCMASDGLEALVTLVRALKETKNNSEKEMVKSCLDFFGVAQVDKLQCSIPQYEGARILKILTDENFEGKNIKNKDKMYVLELHALKSVLEKHLLRRLYEISSDLFARVYQDICPKFIVGLDCATENCSDFHRPLQLFELKGIIRDKVNLVTISGLLFESKKYASELGHEIQEILNANAFQICSNLLQLLFPKHFHLRLISRNPVQSKLLEELLCKAPFYFKKMMNKYVESLFEGLDNKTRRESTDLWLKATQIFTLSSYYHDDLQNLIGREERQYNREYARGDGKRLDGRYGMLIPDSSSESIRGAHIHFFRLLDGAVHELYVNKNPDACKKYFYRFMNVIVKRCVEPLIPNIGNTVMLLEFQCILCFAVLMRFEPNIQVLLPKSYLSILQHWEFMFKRKGNRGWQKDTYSILWNFHPRDVRLTTRQFRHHLYYLGSVLCGEENQEFNVLLDAFSDIDCISSGEAERAFVLCITMVANVNVVPRTADTNLLRYVSMIQEKLKTMKIEFPSKVSKRLVDAVDRVAIADTTEQMVDVLRFLLEERDKESLVECSWKWDPNPGKGQVRGIFFDDKFNFKKFVHGQHSAQDFKYSYVENVQDDRVDIVAELASKVQQKQSVMQKFDELLLLICFCIKWKRAYQCRKKKEIDGTIPDTFKRANVDRTQCDLCGIKFSNFPSFAVLSEEIEDGFREALTTASTDLEESEYLSSEVQNVTQTYDSHITSEEHQHQSTAYNNYLQFYRVQVDTVICEGKSLMHTIEQTLGDHLTSREEFLLEQTKIETKIKVIVDLVGEIYEKKSWSEAEGLLEGPVKDLKTGILATENLMEISKTQMTKPEDLQKEDVFQCEIDYEGFEELENRKSKRSKRKNKRHK